jgi:hypothetical protein
MNWILWLMCMLASLIKYYSPWATSHLTRKRRVYMSPWSTNPPRLQYTKKYNLIWHHIYIDQLCRAWLANIRWFHFLIPAKGSINIRSPVNRSNWYFTAKHTELYRIENTWKIAKFIGHGMLCLALLQAPSPRARDKHDHRAGPVEL